MQDRLITDGDLVLLAGAGEVDALGMLLERHRVPLYAAALAILGDRDAAMDAVQETFVVALTRLDSIPRPGRGGRLAAGSAAQLLFAAAAAWPSRGPQRPAGNANQRPRAGGGHGAAGASELDLDGA